MEETPQKGQRVRWTDPWFYDGEGTVLAHQALPHASTQVMILEIDDPANQSWVGRTTWLLTGFLEVVEEAKPSLAELERRARNSSRTDPSWRQDYSDGQVWSR